MVWRVTLVTGVCCFGSVRTWGLFWGNFCCLDLPVRGCLTADQLHTTDVISSKAESVFVPWLCSVFVPAIMAKMYPQLQSKSSWDWWSDQFNMEPQGELSYIPFLSLVSSLNIYLSLHLSFIYSHLFSFLLQSFWLPFFFSLLFFPSIRFCWLDLFLSAIAFLSSPFLSHSWPLALWICTFISLFFYTVIQFSIDYFELEQKYNEWTEIDKCMFLKVGSGWRKPSVLLSKFCIYHSSLRALILFSTLFYFSVFISCLFLSLHRSSSNSVFQYLYSSFSYFSSTFPPNFTLLWYTNLCLASTSSS